MITLSQKCDVCSWVDERVARVVPLGIPAALMRCGSEGDACGLISGPPASSDDG